MEYGIELKIFNLASNLAIFHNYHLFRYSPSEVSSVKITFVVIKKKWTDHYRLPKLVQKFNYPPKNEIPGLSSLNCLFFILQSSSWAY